MSLKEYSISVKTTGYEYYTVEAHTEEEAIQMIEYGKGYLQSSEVEWDSDFFVDNVIDVEEGEED
jgi:hypothetical protein